jgi:hypothetical protein
VPVNVQNRFLALLVNLADGISQYLGQIWAWESRKRKQKAKDAHLESANVSKKMEVVSGISNDATEADDTNVAMPGREEFF